MGIVPVEGAILMQDQKRDLSHYGGQDPRDLPVYTMEEAAHILWLPFSTLKTWTFGGQWHEPSGIDHGSTAFDSSTGKSGSVPRFSQP
jgi:hypothetical protein